MMNLLNNLKIGKRQWITFFINLGLIFLMVLLQQKHFKPLFFFDSLNAIVSPMPLKVDVFDQILPKLEQKENNFEIKKSSTFIPEAKASEDYQEAQAYGVIDFETGEVLSSKNLTSQIPIASITKVMTAVVALDLASFDEEFVVSENASNQIATKLALIPGEKYTLEELLNAALLVSANDCVEVIKEGVNQKYGEDIFVKAMNEKAKFLKLNNTHFTNPQGLDTGDPYSSVEDQAILINYALNNYPLIKEIVAKDHSVLEKNNNHHSEYLNNWNGLIGVYPGATGVKIGNTEKAQKTTAVIAQREDKKVLVILLGAPGVLERDLWAAQLLDLGFSKSSNLPSVNVTEELLQKKYHTWVYPS